MEQKIVIWTGTAALDGVLSEPDNPVAVAVVLTGAGSEERDRRLVRDLGTASIATVRVNLLTEDEQQFDSRTGHFRYDADFLAHRLIEVAQWVPKNTSLRGRPIAFVGGTIGAAAALVAAALHPELVSAVVSINGRTDLASDYLRHVKTPTLFLLNDMPVLRMNRDALSQIKGDKRIEVIHSEDAQAIEVFVQKAVRWIGDRVAAVELV